MTLSECRRFERREWAKSDGKRHDGTPVTSGMTDETAEERTRLSQRIGMTEPSERRADCTTKAASPTVHATIIDPYR